MLTFTATQFDREVQLVLWHLYHHVERIRGEGFGRIAIGMSDEDSEFARGSSMLEDIPLVGEFAEEARRVKRYVCDARCDSLRDVSTDIQMFGYSVTSILHPAAIAEMQREANNNPEPDADSDENDPNFSEAPGNHYRGILHRLNELAQIRLKIDLGDQLTLAEIANLLELKEATVATAAIRGQFPTEVTKERRWATPRDVMPWLTARGYVPTTFEESPRAADEVATNLVVVPVAGDGSWFSPACRQGAGFKIGPKFAERKIEDYWQALDVLVNQMPVPKWRRRNKEGNWGIVSQRSFERVARADIEKMLRGEGP